MTVTRADRAMPTLTARQFANTWDEDGLHDHGEEINLVDLQHAQSRLDAIVLGVPPLILAGPKRATRQTVRMIG